MQVRKWLISGEINYDVRRFKSPPAPEGLSTTPITLSVNCYFFTIITTATINLTVGTAAGLDMELTVCNSGLKVITKEQGLTEYRAHRIAYNVCPEYYPKLFVWVYKHEGKKLKVSSLSCLSAHLFFPRCMEC